jgi:hypothetical protein
MQNGEFRLFAIMEVQGFQGLFYFLLLLGLNLILIKTGDFGRTPVHQKSSILDTFLNFFTFIFRVLKESEKTTFFLARLQVK